MKTNSFRPKSPMKFLILLTFLFSVFTLSGQENKKNDNGSRTIYLIRHGQYDQNDERDPDIGKGLVPLGIAQARLVADRLKNLHVNITSLISSTMTRAHQTAMIINEDFPELELQQSGLIRECTMPTWRQDIMDKEDPNDMLNCTNNLDSAFAIYFTPSPDEQDKHDIIVCHGNVIRYFVTKVLNVESLSWLQMTVTNCGITVVQVKPGGTMKLESFNDVGHIPVNMQTSTGGDNKLKELILSEQ
jgi:serine/threonine-protein phosphatase PGAM5